MHFEALGQGGMYQGDEEALPLAWRDCVLRSGGTAIPWAIEGRRRSGLRGRGRRRLLLRRRGRDSTGRAWIAIDNDRSSFCHGLRHEADRPWPREESWFRERRGRASLYSRANDAGTMRGCRKRNRRRRESREGFKGRFEFAAGRVGSRFRGQVGRSGRTGRGERLDVDVGTRVTNTARLLHRAGGTGGGCGQCGEALLSVDRPRADALLSPRRRLPRSVRWLRRQLSPVQ